MQAVVKKGPNDKYKRVFSSAYDTIHMFAQQTQYEGRSKNCYFEGDRLYSYGSHFILAWFTPLKKEGKQVVLLNSSQYSVTTSSHQSCCWRAFDETRYYIVRTPVLFSSVEDSINGLGKEVEYALEQSNKPRIRQTTRDSHLATAQEYVSLINLYIEIGQATKNFKFKPGYVLSIRNKYNNLDKVKQFVADKDKILAEIEKKAVKKREKDLPEFIKWYREYWLASAVDRLRLEHRSDHFTITYKGMSKTFSYTTNDNFKHFVLAKIEDNMIITSRYARVELKQGIKLLRFYFKLLKDNKNFIANGKTFDVGGYSLDYIKHTTGEMKLGCHTFTKENIVDFIKRYKLESAVGYEIKA